MTELSIRSADRARELADANCGDCAWYHGLWPLIRALGLGTVPEDHAEFYRSAVRDAVKAGQVRRVLVCGAADASMPLLVRGLLGEQSGAPHVTVVDRCVTPLILCEEAFRSEGARLETLQGDVLDVDPAAPFDLIVTHSFLGYFSGSQRRALFSRWAAWLRPGARVLTVNRLRQTSDGTVGFSEHEAAAFVDRVLAAASARPELTALSTEELRRRARQYADRFRIHPLTSLEEVVDQCEGAGLKAQVVPLGNVSRSGPSGPTAPGAASYYGFILTR